MTEEKLQFGEKPITMSSAYFQEEKSKMAQWVINFSGGHVKTEKQANYVLWAIFAILTVLIIYTFFGGRSSSPNFSSGVDEGVPAPLE